MLEFTRLPNEADSYREAREELRLAELELTRHRERVAELRRRLPEPIPVEDYAFLEGPAALDAGDDPVREVRLSELFSGPGRALIVYHFMFGKKQTDPCPLCTMWIDGWDPVVAHVTQSADFVIAAAADPAPLRAYARSRGWSHLRLLGCGDSTFKYDLASEDEDGNQSPKISVFVLGDDGAPRHTYTGGAQLAPDHYERGIDLLSPVWNLLDLTPQGRGDWYPSASYG